MRHSLWLAIALATTLAGCNQPRTEERATSGEAPPASEHQTAATGDMADAYVEAARAHASLVRNDTSAATTAIRQVREELAVAKSDAPLETQTRINELDQLAIQAQLAIEGDTPEALQASERLVDQMQVALSPGGLQEGPTGGGAGTSVDQGAPAPGTGTAVPPAGTPPQNAPAGQPGTEGD
jgi:hypothetical protein